MGANEKYEAAMHGGEHDFGSADPVSANRVRFMSESELDRFIAKIRIESMVEVLEVVASEPELMHGSTAYVSTDRLLELANQLRKMISDGSQ